MKIKEIIDGCKTGNRKAQKALFNTQYGKLLGVCQRYSSEDAEDMAQEAFLQAYEQFHKFTGKDEAHLFGWLKALAINQYIWEGNRTGKFKEKSTDFTDETLKHPVTNDVLPDVSDEYLAKLDVQTNDVMWAIDMLDDDKRAVFNLVAIDGYSVVDASKKLNISHACGKYRYTKGMKKVKMYIANKDLFKKLNKIANVE